MAVNITSAQNQGLNLVAYAGDQKILLAMSIDEKIVRQNNLAGFAIWRKPQDDAEEALSNRIGFNYGVDSDTTSQTRTWTPSTQAPFQKFRWVDVPPKGFDSPITYRVKALYFAGANGWQTKDGPEASVTAKPAEQTHKRFQIHFTRGYIASQAYRDRFNNADIRPKGAKSPTFDTKPFLPQYQWLGADARAALFDFIADCESDARAKIDVYAYDLDEPDVIAAICRFGKKGRLRAVLDNAPLHSKPNKHGEYPVEVAAAKMITQAAGEANVVLGHFTRFQHNKVFIKRDADGKAQKVLFGSMNFSVRGLYVQANNIVVVEDPTTADMFKRAFDDAFANETSTSKFSANPVSQGYMTASAANTGDLPKFSLALSPHKNADISLGPMCAAVQAAKSSVLYAVMAPTGGGDVLGSLRAIAGNPVAFSYGTVETSTGVAVQNPDGAMGDLTSFAALDKNVPPPFNEEISGGRGMHIHDKFVVVDFNSDNPVVFTGSSNLASGGETANGDSLVRIEDPDIASMYAIEAVAIFDHYRFRQKMHDTPATGQPFTLWYPGKPNAPTPWWESYFDKSSIQLRDRCLFARVPLPAGVDTVKKVDWSALPGFASSATGKGKGAKTAAAKRAPPKKAAASKGAAKKSPAKKPARAGSAKKAAAKKLAHKGSAKKTAHKGSTKQTPAKKPARKVSVNKTAPRKPAGKRRS